MADLNDLCRQSETARLLERVSRVKFTKGSSIIYDHRRITSVPQDNPATQPSSLASPKTNNWYIDVALVEALCKTFHL